MCSSCGRRLGGRRFQFVQGDGETVVMCLRCALVYGPVLRKALATSLVVGTILTAINQGDALLALRLTPILLWKIPLTYFVPFAVSVFSAVSISQVPNR